MVYNVGSFTNNGTFSITSTTHGGYGIFSNGLDANGQTRKDAKFTNNNGTIKATQIQNYGTFIHNGIGSFQVPQNITGTTFVNQSETFFYGNFTVSEPISFINNGSLYIAGGVTLTVPSTPFTASNVAGFTNTGGAITFGFKNGKPALIKSNLIVAGYGSKFIIETDGMNFNQKYQIVDGEIPGDILFLQSVLTIEFQGVNAIYAQYGLNQNGNGLWVWLDKNGNTGNQSGISVIVRTNGDIIKTSISNYLMTHPQAMVLLKQLTQLANDTDKTLQTSVIAQPTNMINAFKTDTLTSPLNSAYVTRLTASSASIMSDASSFANPLEKASQTQFFATPFGGVLKGDDLSGHLLGLSVGLTHIDDDYIVQGHFAYANGTSTQDLQTQSTQINGNLFQVGGFGRLFYDKLETDINANFIFAKFSLDNTWLDNGLNSSSNFNNYQINLGAVAGWRFGDDLSVKPFAGLQTYYENQGEFKQDMLNLTSEAYSALVMDAVVGVEGRYIFENGGFAFAKASYENKLYNSHKEVFMRVGTEALRYENESYDNVASLNLGARVLATKALKLDIEGLYKHYDNGVDYLGANLSVRLSFFRLQ